MMDTARTYCPKFCVTAADSGVEAAMMIRAAQAFNTAAAKSGQNRRAMFF